MSGAARRRTVLDFQSTDQTWQKSDKNKGKGHLTCYIEQIGEKDEAARPTIKTIISELCKDVVLVDEHCITTETICATSKRSCSTAPGPCWNCFTLVGID